MKKLMVFLCLLAFAMLMTFCTTAEEVNFYTIRYDRLDIIQSKEPGIDIKIVDNVKPLKSFMAFTGWSETPGASVPDYLPGDTYAEDRDLMLYAAFAEPNHLGELSDGMTVQAKSICQTQTAAYHSFTVSQSGYYRFATVGSYINISGSMICQRGSYDSPTNKVTGSAILDNYYRSTGFTVTAKLEAGETYYLCFNDPGVDVTLSVKRTDHFTITYDRLDTIQSKEPGGSIKIVDNRKPLKSFMAFTGWSETPGASVPDYLPGDIYSEDRDLMLYAAFAEPNPLGELSDGMTVQAKSICKTKTDAYHTFTVNESGYYRFATVGSYINISGSMICQRNSNDSPTNKVTGSAIYDDYGRATGFTIVAKLEAGETYYLCFNDPGVDVTLYVDTDFHVITYDRLDIIQAKDPGVDIQIVSNKKPLEYFMAFTGWSETPGASVPDFLPGDTFSEDRDLTLYAAFAPASSLGQITGKGILTAKSLCQTRTSSYYTFTVSESGYYRFATQGSYAGLGRPTICQRNSYDSPSNKVDGTCTYDEYGRPVSFSIAAELQTGVTYYLYFTDPGVDVTLLVEPQYSDPDPFGAASAIPRGVTTLEEDAFATTALDSFFCPASITHIDRNTFANCPSLRKIVIAGMHVTIDPAAFTGCTDLLIVAPLNSTAHQFALQYGYEFRALPQE